jgi:hypothetical protein
MSVIRDLSEVFYEQLGRKLKNEKRATRQARGSDPMPMVNYAFEQVEKKGLAMRLIPAIVRKVREIVFARLMAT